MCRIASVAVSIHAKVIADNAIRSVKVPNPTMDGRQPWHDP